MRTEYFISQYGNDIKQIIDMCAFKGIYFESPFVVERLWQKFSDIYCAGWLTLNENTLFDFIDWLEDKYEKGVETNE